MALVYIYIYIYIYTCCALHETENIKAVAAYKCRSAFMKCQAHCQTIYNLINHFLIP